MADPRTTLESVIQTAIDTSLKEVHTCLPAVITKISGQTIEAQPTIKRKIAGELVNLPLLVDVPLRYMKSSKFSISFPMEVGDHVLVIFAERSIDTWLLSGEIQEPGDIRKHSLSDGFAIPMMYPETDLIPDFDSSNLVMKSNNGNTKFVMDDSGQINITGDISVTGDIVATGEITGNSVKLSDHGHQPGTFQDAEARPITGKSGAPS